MPGNSEHSCIKEKISVIHLQDQTYHEAILCDQPKPTIYVAFYSKNHYCGCTLQMHQIALNVTQLYNEGL